MSSNYVRSEHAEREKACMAALAELDQLRAELATEKRRNSEGVERFKLVRAAEGKEMNNMREERDAARAESAIRLETIEGMAKQHANVLVEAALMREALRFYASALRPPYNLADDGKRATDALRDTTAGQAALGVIEAARGLLLNKPETLLALRLSLDAWTQATGNRAPSTETGADSGAIGPVTGGGKEDGK